MLLVKKGGVAAASFTVAKAFASLRISGRLTCSAGFLAAAYR